MYCRERDVDRANASLVTIKGPQVTEFTIKNLSVFTQYLVSLEVRNPEGGGPATTVVVMTDEGVPRSVVQLIQIFLRRLQIFSSAPLNVSTHSITNSSVVVTWEEPRLPNGVIEGYRWKK